MTTTKTSRKTVKPAAKKAPARKASPTKKPTQAAAKPATNQHADAGLKIGDVNRLMNSNRKTHVLLKEAIPAGRISADKRASLYALRNTYGKNAFGVRGLDNGIVRDLVAAGLVSLSGGQTIADNGKNYMVDGETPVMAKITAAGMDFGKA